jgi:hypothetical protein
VENSRNGILCTPSVNPSRKQRIKVVSSSYDIYNVYAALGVVFLIDAAQAFGTMSLV